MNRELFGAPIIFRCRKFMTCSIESREVPRTGGMAVAPGKVEGKPGNVNGGQSSWAPRC